ncbi:MAG: nuclear transport factor 2 family protein [Actinomycetota bacterium]|nr:nuclear transport factor 2 family protein [Actinomycetota bacterium]
MADNVAIVEGVYKALAKGDINTVLGALDEQVEWHLAEHHPLWPGKAFVGPQAVLEGLFAPLTQVYDGFRIDIQRIVALGDTVLAEVRYRGKGKVTGQDLDAQAAHVWDCRDGKCVRWQGYVDTWQTARVLNSTP